MGCGFSKPPEIETALEPLSATVDLFFKEVIGNFVAVNSVEDAVYSSKITVKFIYDSVKQEWVQRASEPSHIISNFIGVSGRNVLEKLNEVVVVGDNEAKPSIINNSSHAKVYPGTYSLNHWLIYLLTHPLLLLRTAEAPPTKPKGVAPPPTLTAAFNKRGHQTKNWKNRYVVINDGVLKYYESVIAKDEGKEALGSITLNDHEVKTVIIDGKKCIHISSTIAAPVKKSMFGSTVVEDKDLHIEITDDSGKYYLLTHSLTHSLTY